jgi:tRNA dimethylallyltransferase
MLQLNNNQHPVICLMGPTASGKTDLAIRLATTLPVEIISVDSAMIYRGMDIGTAKPHAETLKRIPHHLIDCLDPAQAYSVGQFCEEVMRLIRDMTARGRTPLLVGGTMMYFNALQRGLAPLPVRDEAVRAEIEKRAAQIGWEALHQELARLDPERARKIHAQDAQRIERALEIFALTGQSPSQLQRHNQSFLSGYDVINLAVSPVSRPVHHEKIAKRFEAMLAQGLVEEVRQLYQRGDLTDEMPSMRAVGYRQVWRYLAGDYTAEMMRERAIIATRQLAKHQMTWLRTFKDVQWYDGSDDAAIENLIQSLQAVLPHRVPQSFQ